MGKKDFNKIWSNQTNLGKKFGISAVAVGEILVEFKLKYPASSLATEKAIKEGFAKFTPLKNGRHFFMWNIEKVSKLLKEKHQPLSPVDYWVNEVKTAIKEAYEISENGDDKLGLLCLQSVYDQVPANIQEEVRQKIENA